MIVLIVIVGVVNLFVTAICCAQVLDRLDAIERHLFDGKTLAEKKRGK